MFHGLMNNPVLWYRGAGEAW